MRIEVSNGEIVDKLTIIELKLIHSKSSSQRQNLQNEFSVLKPAVESMGCPQNLYKEWYGINAGLWEVEDKLRNLEAMKEFGQDFIALARSVYVLNDKRAEVKKEINFITKSHLVEEKLYNA